MLNFGGVYFYYLSLFPKKTGSRWFPKCIMISPHHIARNSVPEAHRSYRGFLMKYIMSTGWKGYPYIWIDTAPCLNTEANVCNEAAIFAARRSAEKVEMQDFERVPWRKFCHDLVVVVSTIFFIFTRSFWKVSSLNIWQLGGLLDFNVLSYLWIVLGVPPL